MTLLAQYSNLVAAICIWREARSCSRDEKTAVMWTLLNRAADKAHFPLHNRARAIPEGQRLAAIVLDPRQFSAFNSADPNAVKLPRPGGPEWDAFVECCEVVDSPGVSDPTNGANHHHSFQRREDFPKWADDSKLQLTTKSFRFYKL